MRRGAAQSPTAPAPAPLEVRDRGPRGAGTSQRLESPDQPAPGTLRAAAATLWGSKGSPQLLPARSPAPGRCGRGVSGALSPTLTGHSALTSPGCVPCHPRAVLWNARQAPRDQAQSLGRAQAASGQGPETQCVRLQATWCCRHCPTLPGRVRADTHGGGGGGVRERGCVPAQGHLETPGAFAPRTPLCQPVPGLSLQLRRWPLA